MPGSDSDGQPPPRKRSRTSANGGDDGGAGGKKARGRPRVDTQDATAADRRRTQIRLAQRAYRQRKETIISSLKDHNSRLQSIIEQMSKSFLQFNDAVLKSGLLTPNLSLSQQLKHTTETFVTLAKSASEGNIEGEEEAGESAMDLATEAQNVSPTETLSHQSQYQPLQPQHMDIGWGYSAPLEESARQKASESLTRGRQRPSYFFPTLSETSSNESSLVRVRNPVTVGRVMDQGIPWTDARTDERQGSQQLAFGLVSLLSRQQYSSLGTENHHVHSVNIPTPEITPPSTRLPTPPHLPSLSTKTLKPTWTYSHDETTFARRLTRASLETGFHLLSSANQRPAALNYVFKLSLPYMSLSDIRERFKMLLARGTDEELDCWESPFIHLGGAGTHYPRKDARGNIVTIPNAWTVRRIGPISSKMIRAENSTDPSQSHDLNIDLTGFEGEWFDAYDVEGYLEQEKGCPIDPKDSFAEVLIDDDEQPTEPEDCFFANRTLKLNPPQPRRSSDLQSDTPSFSTGSNSTDTMSSNVTPTQNTASNSISNLFAPSDSPFGLDISMHLPTNTNFPAPDFTKFPDIDPSTFFDQPLGLDLAPGFDLNLNPNASTLPQINFGSEGVDMGALGLDLMGGAGAGELAAPQLPVVRQKKKKAAWVDVSKLIDELVKHGVCLGRAPGFRRKDVDMAFQASLITAF